jgi:ubiquinone/menaquinone biosynthesis C-methylase UbiE
LNDNYYDAVQKLFDDASHVYDRDEMTNLIRRMMRTRSLQVLRATFRPGQKILEIGCGTGTEAIELARSNVRIVATDISPQMIAQTKRRVESERLQDRIRVEQLAAHDIGMLEAQYGPRSFDGAYSSFGALNCEPRLKEFVSSLAGLLKPRSSFICSVMNRFCLFDFVLNSILLKRTERLANVSHPLRNPEPLPGYYSVGEFSKMFGGFTIAGVRALPTFLPPPYFEEHLRLLRPAMLKISSLDWELGRLYPFNRIGDHFIVSFRRVNGE